jgi:hypothetical protein
MNAGRIAFRIEGDQWVAYWALPDTMEGALWLASIKTVLVQDEISKRAFMELIKAGLAELLPGTVESWNEQRAPEHERSGSG